jgi:hypothetical protein
MAEQHANPRRIAETLDRYNIPQATLARLSGFSQPMMSMFLGAKKGLGLDAQAALFKALRFLTDLSQGTKVPIDFSNVDALESLWREHLRLECETELIDLAHEKR